MSPLSKEIIEKLNKEEDPKVLAEVLDFYEYLKQKKSRELKNKWANIPEVNPTEDESNIYEQYKNSKEESIDLGNLIQELNLDE